MKLWCQGLFSPEDWNVYHTQMRDYLHGVAEQGTSLELSGVSDRCGEAGTHFRFSRVLKTRYILANALKAERDGFDAFVIVNFMDTGLEEAREVVNIPVVGILQTALLVTSMMASNFALIVPNERARSRYLEAVARYGFKDRLVSIDPLKLEDRELGHTLDDDSSKERLLRQLAEASKKAIDGGAEVIIPTGAPVILALQRNGIRDIENVPVFNSIAAAITMAEMMVKLRQITGVHISRKSKYASPPDEVLKRMGNAYGILS